MNNNTKYKFSLTDGDRCRMPRLSKKPKVGASAGAIMRSLGGAGAQRTYGPALMTRRERHELGL